MSSSAVSRPSVVICTTLPLLQLPVACSLPSVRLSAVRPFVSPSSYVQRCSRCSLHFRPRPAARARSDSSGDEACPSSLFSPRPVDRTPPFCLPGAGPGPGAGAGTAEATSHADEFNFESHREALLAMQRAQRTRLLQATDLELRAAAADLDPRVAGVATDASLAGGASRVTLDSASAHFAASAVRTQVTPGAAAAALRPPPGAAPDGGGARLANGPTASSCDGESTSRRFAENVAPTHSCE